MRTTHMYTCTEGVPQSQDKYVGDPTVRKHSPSHTLDATLLWPIPSFNICFISPNNPLRSLTPRRTPRRALPIASPAPFRGISMVSPLKRRGSNILASPVHGATATILKAPSERSIKKIPGRIMASPARVTTPLRPLYNDPNNSLP